jgi:hypothetical protein
LRAVAFSTAKTIAEVVGVKGERHEPSYRFRDTFRYRTITSVQLSR